MNATCPRRVVPLLLLVCAGAAPAAAQVRPDTLRADTTAADTVRPPAVLFPAMPIAGTASLPDAVWIWDREALLRETPLSLVDLLDRIPGVAAFRAGKFVQPEAAAGFGGTAGRVEIELDGYPLDPIEASTADLSRIPLGQLRELRVERFLGLLRIRLFTEQPTEGQAFSRVEAGIAQPPANMFRGLFLVPHVIVGPLGLGVERIDTDGTGRSEPANVFSGWAKWAWTRPTRGLQLELMRSTLRRETGSPWETDRVQQELVLRGRNEFAPGLLGEVYAGRSTLREKPFFTETSTEPDTTIERDVTHAGVRLSYQSPVAAIAGVFRYRDGVMLPQTEGRVEARLGYGAVSVAGEATRASWDTGEAATTYDLRAQLRAPFGGGVFAELSGGQRGAPDYHAEATAPLFTDRDGWRVGATLSLGQRATGSIALLNLEQDMARPFGLPFDSAAAPNLLEPAQGLEAFGRLVLLPGWLAVESWITNWTESAGWTYLPVRSWRTALELHTLPLPSGNLEILGRLEARQRSGMLAYNPEPPPLEPDSAYQAVVPVASFTLVHAYLQIRIIDVRMFLRYEDLLGSDIEDLPGRIHRGPRLMYGVKWNLRN